MQGDTLVSRDASGNLIITDIGTASNDTLQIQSDVANSRYIIHDPSLILVTTMPGATGNGTNTIFIPFSAVTGGQIFFNTLDGVDTLTIDHTLGSYSHTVTYNGGNPTVAIGDKLIVLGAFGTVTHNMTGADAGNIDINSTGGAEIFYTGLEPVDMSGSTATDYVFNLPNAVNDAILEQDGSFLRLRSQTGTFESTTFAAPSGSITINGGTSTDAVTVAVNPDLTGALTITAETINLNSSVTTGGDQTYNGSVVAGALVNLTAEDVIVNGAVNLGANALTVTVNGTAGTITGGVSGTGGSFVKAGGGTFTLPAAGSYTGGTTVNAGTLVITNGTATGTGAVTVNNNGVFEINNVVHTGQVVLNGTATLRGVGTAGENSGIVIGTGANVNIVTSAAGDVLTLNGSFTNGGGSTVTPTVNYNGPGTVTLTASSAAYRGHTNLTGGILRVPGSASAFGIMSTSGSLTGSRLTLAGGTLAVRSDASVSFNSGGNLGVTVSANSTILQERITPGAGYTITFGTLSIGSQTLTYQMDASMTATTADANLTFANLTTATGDATFNLVRTATNATRPVLRLTGGITDLGVARIVTFNQTSVGETVAVIGAARTLSAASRIDLTGNNTFRLIVEGVSANDLATYRFANTVAAGAALEVRSNTDATFPMNLLLDANGDFRNGRTAAGDGTTLNIGNITFNGSYNLIVQAGLSVNSGTPYRVNANNVILNGANTITVNNIGAGIGTLNLGGVVSEAVAGSNLTKAGTGTLLLSGANTYTGVTTVNAGVLALDGGAAIADNNSVVMANVATAILQLLSSETIGSLAGGGATGGNTNLGAFTLTTGGNGATTSYGGIMSGTGGGLTKRGAGVFTLTGANSFTGATLVEAGTLELGGTAGSIANTSGITVGSAGNTATLLASRTGTHALGTGDVTLGNSGTGTLQITNGTVSIAGGLLDTGTSTLLADRGSLTVASGLTVDDLSIANSDAFTSTATVTVNGGAVSIGTGTQDIEIGYHAATNSNNATGTLDVQNATSVTINVNNFLQGVTAPGAGGSTAVLGHLLLSNTGTNTITATGWTIGDSPSPGNTGGTSTVQFGAGINTVNANTWVIGGRKSLASVTTDSGGTLTLNGRNGVGTTTNLHIGTNTTSTGTVNSGVLNLAGGTFNATLNQLFIGRHNDGVGSGNGTLTFDAGTVTATTIELARSDAGGTSTNDAATTGTLNMNGGLLRFGTLSGFNGTEDVNWSGGTIQNLSGQNLTVSNVVIELLTGATHTLTVDSGRTATVNANANFSGVGTLTKDGAGLLTLAGVNTHLGVTTVSAGTLSLTGSLAGAAVVNNTGTLQGTGTVGGSTTINVGGILAPGIGGVGTITSNGGISLNGTFQIDATAPAGLVDLITVVGTVQTGGSINLTGTGNFASVAQLLLISNDGTDSVTGMFAGYAEGAQFDINGVRFHLTYAGGDGNDVVLLRNQAPVFGGLTPALDYAEDDGAVTVSPALTLSDSNGADQIVSASVEITGNYQAGEDALSIDLVALAAINPAIVATIANNLITLTGSASVADYQAALRLVTYTNSSQDPNDQPRTLTYMASDGDLTGTATRTVNVAKVNDAPVVAVPSVANIDENGSATLTGSFTDVDSGDTHTVTINWGDPNNGTNSTFALPTTGSLGVGQAFNSSTDGAVLTITAFNASTGQVSFTVNGHQFLDDGPSGAPGNGTGSDVSTVTLTVNDLAGGVVSNQTTVTISNVAPTVQNLSATPVNENSPTTLTGSFTDPGRSDQHILTVNWDDPNNSTDSVFTLSATSGLTVGMTFTSSTDGAILTITSVSQLTGEVGFSVQHVFLDDGAAPGNSTGSDVSTITVTVADDDGGSGNSSTTVTVTNVNPTPVTDSAGVAEDSTVDIDLLAGAYDTGTLDSFQLNTHETVSTKGAIITLSPDGRTVTYDTNGQFNHLATGQTETDTFTYSIIDDDGGITYSTVTVTVTGGNDGPVLQNTPQTDQTYEERQTERGYPPVYVAPDVALSDLDDTHLEGTVVRIVAGYRPGDIIEIADEARVEGITITRVFDPENGMVTLTFMGPATLDQYEDMIRAVTFRNLFFNPTGGVRAIEVFVFDGENYSNIGVSRINVVDTPLYAELPPSTPPGTPGAPGTPGTPGSPGTGGLDLNGIRNVLRNLAESGQITGVNGFTADQIVDQLYSQFEGQLPYLNSFLSGLNLDFQIMLTDSTHSYHVALTLRPDGLGGVDPFADILILDATTTDEALRMLSDSTTQ